MVRKTLEFVYSAMCGGKTANMVLRAKHSELSGRKILLAKPRVDTRYDVGIIKSRCGIEMECDICADLDFNFVRDVSYTNVDTLFVDEAQFLSSEQIDQLREVVDIYGVSVLCYGLLTDFKKNLFDGSKRLVELCDRISELDVTCNFCGENAKFNLKYIGGRAIVSGSTIDINTPNFEKYVPVCHGCWMKKTTTTEVALGNQETPNIFRNEVVVGIDAKE